MKAPKTMKLYDGNERIYRELANLGLGRDAPLRVADLTPFDQYHYHGTAAVDEAIKALELKPGMRVLDIGSGLGGPARYIAERTGAHVTALELQEDLSAIAEDLTRRCGLSDRVEHCGGNVLDGVRGTFDAIISMLCFLHIPDRTRLFSVCRAALVQGGTLYVEDYACHRTPTEEEAAQLSAKVQCPYVPGITEYRSHLASAGFSTIELQDVTENWTAFTRDRCDAFKAARQRNVNLHGEAQVNDLEDFYDTVARLFAAGAVAGLKITAR